MRAYAALVGLGINRIEDTVYINAKWDLKGNNNNNNIIIII